MSQIFKATMYRILKSRILVYSVICSLLLPLVFSLMGLTTENKEQGLYGTWDNFFFIINILFLAVVCAYNCADYKNKTINFEIMGGHSSAEIFAGRGVAFVAVTEILFNAGLVIVHLMLRNSSMYCSVIDNNNLYVLRIAAIEMVFLAYIVFYVFVSFIAKNTIIALVISWIGFGIGGLAVFLDGKVNLPGIGNLGSIVGPHSVKGFMLGGVTAAQGIISIAISLCLIILFVIIGIVNLSKQEF